MKGQSSTTYLVMIGVVFIVVLVVAYLLVSGSNTQKVNVKAIKEQMANNYPIGIVEAQLVDGYLPYIVVRNNADRAMYVSGPDAPYLAIGMKGKIWSGGEGYLWLLTVKPVKLQPGETAVLDWTTGIMNVPRLLSYDYCQKPGQAIPVMFQIYGAPAEGMKYYYRLQAFEGVIECQSAMPESVKTQGKYYHITNPNYEG